MGMIDSGLGWSCPEEYYVNTSMKQLIKVRYSNTYYFKNNSGPAAAIGIKCKLDVQDGTGFQDGTIAVLISTVEKNVELVPSTYASYTTYNTSSGPVYISWVGDYRNTEIFIPIYKDIGDNTEWFSVVTDFIKAYIVGNQQTIPVRWNDLETSFDITVT